MLEVKLGDRITYQYDDGLAKGVVCWQGDIEDDENTIFKWFSQDGSDDVFDIADPDDVRRIVVLSNVFD